MFIIYNYFFSGVRESAKPLRDFKRVDLLAKGFASVEVLSESALVYIILHWMGAFS